jgi:4'-phosphopantetheinyl transferase
VPWPISISHSNGRALCAIALPYRAIGCDLERVEPRTDEFTREWFTPPEQDVIAQCDPARRDELVTLLWSAKESALKALGTGLTTATVDLTVNVVRVTPDAKWNPLRVNRVGGRDPMFGWWSRDGADVMTVVTAPASEPPVPVSRCRSQR